jgi:hypothetical protein
MLLSNQNSVLVNRIIKMGVTDFELAQKMMDYYLKTGILTKDVK